MVRVLRRFCFSTGVAPLCVGISSLASRSIMMRSGKYLAAHILVWGINSFRERRARLLCDEVFTEYVVGYSLLLAQYFVRLCVSRYIMQNGDLREVV